MSPLYNSEIIEKPTIYSQRWSNGYGVTSCVHCGTNAPLDYSTGLCDGCKSDNKLYKHAKSVAEKFEEYEV